MANDRLQWLRSRRCESGACVEVAISGGQVFVRQSTDPDGPVLTFPRSSWASFLGDVCAGKIDC